MWRQSFLIGILAAAVLPVPRAEADLRQLTFDAAPDFWATWSPDGSTIAFVSTRGGRYEIWGVPVVGGGDYLLLSEPGKDLNRPAWSPVDNTIAFTADGSGRADLWIANIDTGIRTLLVTGRCREPSWSTDGDYLAYGEYSGGLLRYELATGDVTLLNGNAPVEPSWSPDDQWVISGQHVGADLNLMITPSTGGPPVQLTSGWYDRRADWHPSGEYVLFHRQAAGGAEIADLWLLSLADTTTTQHTFGLRAAYAAWSPDGTKVAFSRDITGDWNIWVMDFEDLCPAGSPLAECRPLTDNSVQLFAERFTRPLSDFPSEVFDRTKVDVGAVVPGDRFWISGSPSERAPLVASGQLAIGGVPSGLCYGSLPSQTLLECQPITNGFGEHAAFEVTNVVSQLVNETGQTCHRFELALYAETEVVGNGDIYLLKEPATPTITGTVVDNHNSEEIEDAVVSLVPANGTTPVTTGSDGRFEFADIPAGEYQVFATRPDEYYADAVPVGISVEGDGVTDITLRMDSKLVVLAHGICADVGIWGDGSGDDEDWLLPLQQAQWKIARVHFDPNGTSFFQQALELVTTLDALQDNLRVRSFQVVAHSMGGLAIRQYIKNGRPQTVSRLVMIGTPNHGSPVAHIMHDWLIEAALAPDAGGWIFFHTLTDVGKYIGAPDCDRDALEAGLESLKPRSHALNLLNFDGEDRDTSSCQPSYSEEPIENDLTEYWSIAGECVEGLDRTSDIEEHCGDGWDGASDGVVPRASTKIRQAIWCRASTDWMCDAHHRGEGCKSLYETPCIRAKVLQILDGATAFDIDCSDPSPRLADRPYGREDDEEWVTLHSQAFGLLSGEEHRDTVSVATAGVLKVSSLGSKRLGAFFLIDPLGTVIDSTFAEADTTVTYRSSLFESRFDFQQPMAGPWEVVSSAAASPDTLVRLTRVSQLVSYDLTFLSPPQIDADLPVPVTVAFMDTSAIVGATVNATVLAENDSTTFMLELRDDGLSGDGMPDDGVYGGSFDPMGAIGTYNVLIEAASADAPPRTAELTEAILVQSLSDLSVAQEDIALSNESPVAGELVSVIATVRNLGTGDADSVEVTFADLSAGGVFYSVVLGIEAGASAEIVGPWIVSGPPAEHTLSVGLSSLGEDAIESSYVNNQASVGVTVGTVLGTPGDPNDWEENEQIGALAVLPTAPNPFSTKTAVRFLLPHKEFVEVQVFDVSGRRVKVLAMTTLEGGRHTVYWNGVDEKGAPAQPGVYFYQVKTVGGSQVGRMVLMR